MTAKDAVVKSADEPADDPLENMLLFFNLSIRKLAFVGVSLPLITLLTCLATAYVFQYDDVHETHCRVSIILSLYRCALDPQGCLFYRRAQTFLAGYRGSIPWGHI